ncbi:hypothetical protein [Paenibacillus sp. PDC88]|uniref:hypothetical protein n=1 Tax=Paenibacillus sp. PDC88 TaxID=1884375 RepID=UPI000898F7BE|nr:hypothetical protein [Paenibacillus sp. PDC88]SDX81450.1 hypothetical protein SAMN05518848_11723 [Paenibacillus sp. PDC88]
MERYQEAATEFRDLKKASADLDIPKIDVLEPVMQRIYVLEKARPAFWQRVYGLPFNKMITTGSLFIALLLVSFTAYAASEYIQILNKEGQIKVQHVPSNTDSISVLDNKYGMKAYARAKPGELVAYYVEDSVSSERPESQLYFQYKEHRIEQYAAFTTEIERTDALIFPKTLAGYTFEYGTVNASSPLITDITKDPYYQGVLDELMLEAEQDTSEEKVFIKSIPWTEPSSVSAKYSIGKAHVNILVLYLHGSQVTVNQETENNPSVIRISGTDVIYNEVKKDRISYDYVNWYDEKQDAYFTISANGEQDLDKEQLLSLASEFINP